VIADYAQIELRIAAALAPCPEMTAVFRGGADPHRATAATLTGRAEVGNEERKLAKAINFGFLFGMGARRFRDYAAQSFGIALDDGQASRAREAFFATFPGIARWHARTRDLARVAEREPVTVTTVMGRRKRFDPGTFSFNAALNIPVQGTAAEGFKAAMARLRAELASLNGRGVLCVHDEYIAEVPEDRAAEARTRVEAVMVESMQALVPAVPIVVETRVAPHWGEQ
jgi:DNA polymerase-1